MTVDSSPEPGLIAEPALTLTRPDSGDHSTGLPALDEAAKRWSRLRRDLLPLYALAAALICAAASWYLLKELATLLRPLVLAIFLAYTILPLHRALRRRVPERIAGPLLALVVAGLVVALAAHLYGNLIALREELPRLIDRGRQIQEQVLDWGRGRLPAWVMEAGPRANQTEVETTARLRSIASSLVNTAASFMGEALVVGFYLIFLLLEVRQFPLRIRDGLSSGQAERVLGVLGAISEAMASYLRAKALASLITALPVVAILWAFDVSFPVTWGVLTFVGNFIPYVGGLVALALPALLALLELNPMWKAATVVGLLLLTQFVINNFIEPQLTARAVDLSPLVVLIALAFWGLCWGVVGMVLAVPLTVMLKVIWQNVDLTRPLARLMSQD